MAEDAGARGAGEKTVPEFRWGLDKRFFPDASLTS